YSQQNGYFNLIPRPDNTGSFDCTIMGDAQYSQCDDDQDGQVVYDLNAIADDLTEGDNTLEVKFYSDETSAENDSNENLVTSPFTITEMTIIYALINNAECEIIEIVEVTLSIYEAVSGAQDVSEYFCDTASDGVEIIDLTSLNVLANPRDYTITYYETEQDATEG